MLVAILAFIGIPPWILLVGVLIILIRDRNQFKKKPGVFPVRLRTETGSYPGIKSKWPISTSFAHWVHDVLLVHTFLPLESIHPIPVTKVEATAESSHPLEVKGLGDQPVMLKLQLDDGTIVQMAIPDDFQALAQGPFPHSEPST